MAHLVAPGPVPPGLPRQQGLVKTGDSPYMEAPPIPSRPNSRQNTPKRERLGGGAGTHAQPQQPPSGVSAARDDDPAPGLASHDTSANASFQDIPSAPSRVPGLQGHGASHHTTPQSTPGMKPLPNASLPPSSHLPSNTASSQPLNHPSGASGAHGVGSNAPTSTPVEARLVPVEARLAPVRPPAQGNGVHRTDPMREVYNDPAGGYPGYREEGYPPAAAYRQEPGGIATPPPPGLDAGRYGGGAGPGPSRGGIEFAALDRVRQLEQQLASTQEQLIRERHETQNLHRAFGEPFQPPAAAAAPPLQTQHPYSQRVVHQPPLPLSPPPVRSHSHLPPGYRVDPPPPQPYRPQEPPGPTTPGAWRPGGMQQHDAPIFSSHSHARESDLTDADRYSTSESVREGSPSYSAASVRGGDREAVERLQRLLDAEREANEELKERFGRFLQTTQAQLREIREEVRAKEEENVRLRHTLGDMKHDHGDRPHTTITISPRGRKDVTHAHSHPQRSTRDERGGGGRERERDPPRTSTAGRRLPSGGRRATREKPANVYGYSKEITNTPQPEGWQHLG